MAKRTIGAFILLILLAGCLEDGRTEAEYLEDYLEVVPDAGTDPVLPTGEPVVVATEESEACSTEEPADAAIVQLRNTADEILFVHELQPDCSEVQTKQIHLRSRIGVRFWPGAVRRIRTEDGSFVVELTGGEGPYPTELEVP